MGAYPFDSFLVKVMTEGLTECSKNWTDKEILDTIYLELKDLYLKGDFDHSKVIAFMTFYLQRVKEEF